MLLALVTRRVVYVDRDLCSRHRLVDLCLPRMNEWTDGRLGPETGDRENRSSVRLHRDEFAPGTPHRLRTFTLSIILEQWNHCDITKTLSKCASGLRTTPCETGISERASERASKWERDGVKERERERSEWEWKKERREWMRVKERERECVYVWELYERTQ